MLRSPEFWRRAAEPRLKTPWRFVVSALRTLDAEVDSAEVDGADDTGAAGKAAVNAMASSAGTSQSGAGLITEWLGRMGQPLYGYLDEGGYSDSGEYWLEPASLMGRFVFARTLAGGELNGITLPAVTTSTTDNQMWLMSPEFQYH